MHEFSLINDLMRKINDLARENNARRVVGVQVALGALAHISAGHFREHFEQAAAGTLAEGARLEIKMLRDEADPHAQEIRLVGVEVEE